MGHCSHAGKEKQEDQEYVYLAVLNSAPKNTAQQTHQEVNKSIMGDGASLERTNSHVNGWSNTKYLHTDSVECMA